MPNITHDSTFAMRVAKSKKLVRYNSTVCPKCAALIPIEERDRHVASCNAKIPPVVIRKKKRRKATTAAVANPLRRPVFVEVRRSPVVLAKPGAPGKPTTSPLVKPNPAALVPCPHCGAQIRGTKLARHIAERCTKAPADIVAHRRPSISIGQKVSVASVSKKRKQGHAGALGRWSNPERDAQVVANARAAREARESMSD